VVFQWDGGNGGKQEQRRQKEQRKEAEKVKIAGGGGGSEGWRNKGQISSENKFVSNLDNTPTSVFWLKSFLVLIQCLERVQVLHCQTQHKLLPLQVTTVTVYATLFMYCLLLEDASLPRHVSVQLWTIFRWHTCGPYENYYAYNGSVVLDLIFFSWYIIFCRSSLVVSMFGCVSSLC
jgi:hypothetical protein